MRAVPSSVVIRPATLEDAAGCAFVHHASWVETYSALLPAERWESDTLERRTATWEQWLAGELTVTVAEMSGRIVGVAFANAGRLVGEHPPVRDRELWLLYVLAAHHGTGVGQALLDAVLPPGSPAQVWVVEDNLRARGFYGRNGFRPDGARDVDAQSGLASIRCVR